VLRVSDRHRAQRIEVSSHPFQAVAFSFSIIRAWKVLADLPHVGQMEFLGEHPCEGGGDGVRVHEVIT